MLEQLPCASLLIRGDGNIVCSNTLGSQLFEKKESFIDKNFYLLFDTADAEKVKVALRQSQTHMTPQSTIIYYKHKALHLFVNGTKDSQDADDSFTRLAELHFLIVLTPLAENLPHEMSLQHKKSLLDYQQQINVLCYENQLINAQLKEKEQIEYYIGESEKRFRLLAENSTDMISMHDSQGKILYVSPACKTLLNYDPKELTKKNFYRLFHYSDLDKVKDLQHAIDSFQNTITLTYRVKHKEGHHIWLESNIKIIRDHFTKQVIEMQAASRDVTARILADKNRQKDKLIANANRLTTMEEMASGMAHEINQPLAAIVNYTQGCVRHLESGNANNKKVIEVMKKAVEQSERAGEIIHRLKQFFSKGKLYCLPEAINSIIRESVNFISNDIINTNTQIIFQLAKRLPKVEVDKIQLQQVILNLVQNAIESMQDAESDHRSITLSSQKKNNTLIISIEDSGPGIPLNLINRVYAPFFTTKSYGTGMGLSICRSIVEAHGGQLEIISRKEEHNGAILIKLPIENSKQEVYNEQSAYRICSR